MEIEISSSIGNSVRGAAWPTDAAGKDAAAEDTRAAAAALRLEHTCNIHVIIRQTVSNTGWCLCPAGVSHGRAKSAGYGRGWPSVIDFWMWLDASESQLC